MLAACTLFGNGCGPEAAPAFDTRFPDNDSSRTAAVLAEWSARREKPGPGNPRRDWLVAATTFAPEPELIVYNIGNRSVIWRRPIAARSRPEILGDLLLTVEREDLAAFDLYSGRPRWRAPLGAPVYLGAARVGSRLVFTADDAGFGSKQISSLATAVDAVSGKVLWKRRCAGRLGAPAALGDTVLVPWDWQNLAALDIATGRERARFRSTDDVINWITSGPAGVFFGYRSVYRLDGRGYFGNRQSAQYLASPLKGAPGNPALRESAFDPKPASRSAQGRIRILFDLEPDGPDQIRILDDRFYLVFYRYIFAFDRNDMLVWCSVLDRDVIGGRAVRGGVISVEESGAISLFDAADGGIRMQAQLPAELGSATVDALGLGPVSFSRDRRPTGRKISLRAGLARVALDPDNRLVQARLFSIEQLGRLPEPEAARDLLDLYEEPRLPGVLKEATTKALQARSTGSEYLRQALQRHYDFLRDSRPPPLAVIAPALIRMRDAWAVPLLIGHMFDPDTPLEALPAVVSGVVELGDSAAIEPLRSFLFRYRADSSFANAPQALAMAAEGLLRLGTPDDRELLSKLASDSRTNKLLAESVRRLLEPKSTAIARASSGEQPVLPDRLSRRQIDATFADNAKLVRACLAEETGRNPTLSQVRVAFIINRDGSAYGFKFLPDTPELADCLAPRIAAFRFPAFRGPRQVAGYTIAVPADLLKTPGSDRHPRWESEDIFSSADDKAWWAWYAKRNNPYRQPKPGEKPWWMRGANIARPTPSSVQPPQPETPWWLPALGKEK